MSVLRVYVEGIGLWSPQLANFAALQNVLAGVMPEPAAARPAAATLPANERRRAPESVLLAVEAAGQAVAMSNRDATTLACVFASAYGDQAITDYMCATLARTPTELSPIRFHNSVHNAAVGYWTIATGCHAPSTSICAQAASFGAALLEAASQAVAEQHPVLLVCSDIGCHGPLGDVIGSTQPFGSALVLAPQAGASARARLDLAVTAGSTVDPLIEPLAGWRAATPSAAGLPLLALLAGKKDGCCQLAAAASLGLQVDMVHVA